MELENIKKKYISRDDNFYANYYRYFIFLLMAILLIILIMDGVILFQVLHRPLPQFAAKQEDGKTMLLTPFEEPNLLPDTLLRWASKAATIAYTFDFVNYETELAQVHPYFTDAGWEDFRSAISSVISTVVQNQLFVTGVVSGAPIIANQGPLPGKEYVWRVQIPFLVTYQSANTTTTSYFIVVLSIIRVPTFMNPQGIGIDQFVMVKPYGV